MKFPLIEKITLFSVLLCSSQTFAAGLMAPTSSSLPALEIKEHHVNVVIEDGFAITSIEQVFYNPNADDLEAIYSFPIPEKAAVGEFTYWIDGQPVTGEVIEKQKARAIYEEERQAGRETAITEQDEYKTFDISVYPIRALQDVRINLTYIQPAHVDTSIGRYVYPLEEGGVDQERLAFWTYNEEVKERFSFTMQLRSSYPIDLLRLPQHPQALVQQVSEEEWSVALVNDSEAAVAVEEGANPINNSGVVQTLDQDIVVYWRHQQGLPGSVEMITHREEGVERGTFMMTVTPGDDLARITEGRDWIFVLDYSGSMAGKFQSMVEGVKKGLINLNPADRFRVVLFNDGTRELTNGFVNATPENIQNFLPRLESTEPQNGTNLYAGLKQGINGLDDDRSSAIILVTDGVANVGVTEKKRFLDLMEDHDVRLFTFVMGNSANRPMLEGMADVSNGFAISISNSDDIVGRLVEATSKLTHEAFHDVEVNFSGVKIRDLSPDRIGTVYRGQQLIVFGHYWGQGEAKVNIEGQVSGVDKTYSTSFNFPQQTNLHPEIERLWAYAKIQDLQSKMEYLGQDSDTEQAITDLAVEYGLVTNYTSLLVVREEVFKQRNIDRNNAGRVDSELAARQQRQTTTVRNNRVDQQQPMFNTPAPTHGSHGGGALGPWFVLLLLPLYWLSRRSRFIAQ